MTDHTDTLGRVEFRTRPKGRLLGSVTHYSGSWVADAGGKQTLHNHFYDALREALDRLADGVPGEPAPRGSSVQTAFRCAHGDSAVPREAGDR